MMEAARTSETSVDVVLRIWQYIPEGSELQKHNSLCSELYSGIYCRVKLLSTDVSEVRTASIIRMIIPDEPNGGFVRPKHVVVQDRRMKRVMRKVDR
jgi:hypothetical protein